MKIPNGAKRVFKGILFDVYQWQQKMYDGSYSTFEMLKRVNTVEIIAVHGEKILLTHQSQPTKTDFYSLIGGRAEENEEPMITAQRELLEEAGLTSDDWELLTIYEPMHKIDWSIYLYVARNCMKKAKQALDAGEKIELVECTFDQFVSIIQSEKYWGTELALDILKMKYDPSKLEKFKSKLFGNPLS